MRPVQSSSIRSGYIVRPAGCSVRAHSGRRRHAPIRPVQSSSIRSGYIVRPAGCSVRAHSGMNKRMYMHMVWGTSNSHSPSGRVAYGRCPTRDPHHKQKVKRELRRPMRGATYIKINIESTSMSKTTRTGDASKERVSMLRTPRESQCKPPRCDCAPKRAPATSGRPYRQRAGHRQYSRSETKQLAAD
jgi:hypothetical protein